MINGEMFGFILLSLAVGTLCVMVQKLDATVRTAITQMAQIGYEQDCEKENLRNLVQKIESGEKIDCVEFELDDGDEDEE
jgi:hypothetical protein